MNISLDVFLEDGFDVKCSQPSVEDTVADKLLYDKLYAALDQLTSEERSLIEELYFHEKSVRELSKEIGIPFQTIHSRMGMCS